MTTQPAQRLLRTPDAAILLGLSARTLEKHRCYGTGPAYRKLGGRVVYSVDDLLAWADQGMRRSTSDATASVVHPAKRIDLSILDQKGVVRR
jgi:predicted DNA-binding transcriptional regulator AlpA